MVGSGGTALRHAAAVGRALGVTLTITQWVTVAALSHHSTKALSTQETTTSAGPYLQGRQCTTPHTAYCKWITGMVRAVRCANVWRIAPSPLIARWWHSKQHEHEFGSDRTHTAAWSRNSCSSLAIRAPVASGRENTHTNTHTNTRK